MALAPPPRQTDRERRRFFDGFQARFPELALRWGNTFARWRDVPGTELVVSHYITNHSIGVFVRGQRGVLASMLAANRPTDEAVEELYLRTVSRYPDAEEKQWAAATVAKESREKGLQDVFWALVNSKEFLYNH